MPNKNRQRGRRISTSAFGPETDISDGLMRPDLPLPRSLFPTAYFLPLPGQAVIAAAAMLLNAASGAALRSNPLGRPVIAITVLSVVINT
jgi:hypothetical protein